MALEEKHWVRLNSTVAYFAMWALRQSPYGWPDDLQLATAEFKRQLADKFAEGLGDSARLSKSQLNGIVYTIIASLPICRKWNTPKANPGAEFVFVSAFSKNHPDHDCIDLNALSGNITMSAWKESLQY